MSYYSGDADAIYIAGQPVIPNTARGRRAERIIARFRQLGAEGLVTEPALAQATREVDATATSRCDGWRLP